MQGSLLCLRDRGKSVDQAHLDLHHGAHDLAACPASSLLLAMDAVRLLPPFSILHRPAGPVENEKEAKTRWNKQTSEQADKQTDRYKQTDTNRQTGFSTNDLTRSSFFCLAISSHVCRFNSGGTPVDSEGAPLTDVPTETPLGRAG